MNKFNKGQEVMFGEQLLTVDDFRPIMGTYQYSFKDEDGEFMFACGESSLIAVNEDECNDPREEETYDRNATYLNTMANSFRKSISGDEFDIHDATFGSLFFKPSRDMVKWLVEYAKGRMLIDVGSGQGHLVRMIKREGGMCIGLEPNIDIQKYHTIGMMRYGADFDINEILQMDVEMAKGLIEGLGKENKAMLVFARPCHSNFVEVGIRNMPDGMEALYITVPVNLELYNDLGQFRDDAQLIEHEGVSEDSEVVYSIIKNRK